MDGLNGVLILAGGKSERMNFPKAYLLYDGKTFLQKIIDEYVQAGIKNIFVVLNEDFSNGEWKKYLDPIKSNVSIIKNPNPELGRFYSLKLGIKKMLNNPSTLTPDLEFCFIQNIDNPFVNKALIKTLMKSKNPAGYTSPVFIGRNGHPILISKKIIQHINNLPDENQNLRNILLGFSKHEVPVDNDDILVNINTGDDYERFIKNSYGLGMAI